MFLKNQTLSALSIYLVLMQKRIIPTVTYPEIFWDPLVSKITPFSVMRSPSPHPPPSMVRTEGSKSFEFNTSTLLEKALKALLRHF